MCMCVFMLFSSIVSHTGQVFTQDDLNRKFSITETHVHIYIYSLMVLVENTFHCSQRKYVGDDYVILVYRSQNYLTLSYRHFKRQLKIHLINIHWSSKLLVFTEP